MLIQKVDKGTDLADMLPCRIWHTMQCFIFWIYWPSSRLQEKT